MYNSNVNMYSRHIKILGITHYVYFMHIHLTNKILFTMFCVG